MRSCRWHLASAAAVVCPTVPRHDLAPPLPGRRARRRWWHLCAPRHCCNRDSRATSRASRSPSHCRQRRARASRRVQHLWISPSTWPCETSPISVPTASFSPHQSPRNEQGWGNKPRRRGAHESSETDPLIRCPQARRWSLLALSAAATLPWRRPVRTSPSRAGAALSSLITSNGSAAWLDTISPWLREAPIRDVPGGLAGGDGGLIAKDGNDRPKQTVARFPRR
jgi:hypothetical protein